MTTKRRPTFLNYFIPIVMIDFGLFRFCKHGVDILTIIPIIIGCFGLYLAFFNHLLLQRIEQFLEKNWYPVGQFITVILLTLTFYIVFAPVGLILRLFKKDILNKTFKVAHLTYWTDKDTKVLSNYTQQF